ncbi:hypothetical protein [Egicoccus sp. AB-alg2]|uniref:DUF7144 family membrane protein n=1 Tax=Egicoccus sp. AB-alg2 TaxID=3242693 RepID=UPI00359D94A4
MPEVVVFDRTWILLAALLFVISGSTNVVAGLGMLLGGRLSSVLTPFVDPPVWGWTLVALGGLQALSCLGLFAHRAWAGSLGIGTAGTTVFVQAMLLPLAPAVAGPLIGVNVLGISSVVGRGPSST